ncbi:alpha/beta hydrolase [Candidatus Gracilibacteria bacterium]|nr:alpha/beta hydrolase [Candidatus Gracilibacteria bacterium]
MKKEKTAFFIIKWLITLTVIYTGWVVVMYSLQDKFIFQPTTEMIEHPVARDLSWEDVEFPTSDGETLHGWWTDNNEDKTILFFHGNAQNISHRTGQLFIFQRLGKNFLIFDYRGYGLSSGQIEKEADFYEDAHAALKFLIEEKNIPPEKIVLWGKSVGSAGVLELAQEYSFSKIVLESPFFSLGEVAQYHYPFLPAKWMIKYKFRNGEKIPKITSPLLIFHSKEDEVVPFSQGQKLFEASPEPKTFVQLEGAHNRAIHENTETYLQALKEFFE